MANQQQRKPMVHEQRAGQPWDASYQGRRAPWDIGRPQPAIERLIAAGAFSGAVLDVGCGTGENALLIAAQGLPVLGVDVAPTAIAVAQTNAKQRASSAEFAIADAFHLARLKRCFQTVLDCGLFHALEGPEPAAYAKSLARVVETGGVVYMLCFRKEAERTGPHPVTQAQIRAAFTPQRGWHVERIVPESLAATFQAEIPAWLATLRRITPAPA